MKITIDIDVTPEEARRFLGLPDVEKIQMQLLENAQQYLKDQGEANYGEFVASAMQPMLAYQDWVSRMMSAAAGQRGDGNPKKD